MFSSKENINILTALLVDYKIRHIVVCPGSRNAPLVHNFYECPYFECHPVTDERSAAFVALGIAWQTNEIVAVCVTSGSALLNVLPGVAEASCQKRGIVVISADRPQAWIGQLDGQTMPQQGALGSFVGKSVSLPECKDDTERWMCRRLVCEAILALEETSKSVHINVPIPEPLFEFTTPSLPDVRAVFPVYWGEESDEEMFLSELREAKRPMIVLGQTDDQELSDGMVDEVADMMVVLSEQLSPGNPSPSLDVLFTLMGKKVKDYQPDVLLYVGGNTISKKLRQFLRDIPECTVFMHNDNLQLEDTTMKALYVLKGNLEYIFTAIMFDEGMPKHNAFYTRWQKLFAKTHAELEKLPASLEEQAVMELEKYYSPDDKVFYANSSSIRMAARHARHQVYCNRGLNGIDGSLSTAVGASLVSEDKVFCVIGDLSFFYDQNALWNRNLRGNLRILLLNNGGGRIFESLPGLEKSPAMGEMIMATHNTTAEGVCMEYGIAHLVVTREDELEAAIQFLTKEESHRPILVEVKK